GRGGGGGAPRGGGERGGGGRDPAPRRGVRQCCLERGRVADGQRRRPRGARWEEQRGNRRADPEADGNAHLVSLGSRPTCGVAWQDGPVPDVTRSSDVGPAVFEPWPDACVHVEWGPHAARRSAARGDAVVIVDVLSFSTTLTVAVERGCECVVYAGAELDELGGREAAAARLGARPLAPDRRVAPGDVSLSPASILRGARDERLLVTSLNGAACVSAAA